MTTKMNVFIKIPGRIDSKKLYDGIKCYHANVTDLGVKTLVYVTIDVREPVIEYILQTCYKYGGADIKVDAKMVVE